MFASSVLFFFLIFKQLSCFLFFPLSFMVFIAIYRHIKPHSRYFCFLLHLAPLATQPGSGLSVSFSILYIEIYILVPSFIILLALISATFLNKIFISFLQLSFSIPISIDYNYKIQSIVTNHHLT